MAAKNEERYGIITLIAAFVSVLLAVISSTTNLMGISVPMSGNFSVSGGNSQYYRVVVYYPHLLALPFSILAASLLTIGTMFIIRSRRK